MRTRVRLARACLARVSVLGSAALLRSNLYQAEEITGAGGTIPATEALEFFSRA